MGGLVWDLVGGEGVLVVDPHMLESRSGLEEGSDQKRIKRTRRQKNNQESGEGERKGGIERGQREKGRERERERGTKRENSPMT